MEKSPAHSLTSRSVSTRNDQQLNKADSIDLEVSCDFFEFKSSDLKADAEHGQRCGGVTDHFYGAADQVRQLDVQQE